MAVVLFGLLAAAACEGGESGGGGEGGNDDTACGFGEVLDYTFHWCGPPPDVHDSPANCIDRPAACPTIDQPVCGCDGVIYGNECSAHAAGVDIGVGTCEASLTPEGMFPCGPYFCSPETTYCDIGLGDVSDRYYACEPLPAACDPANLDCSCLGNDADDCQTVQGNGVEGLEVSKVLL